MPEILRDGKGRGYLAAVNSDNQLITRATAVEQRLASTADGNYYEATTGQITLTDAVETGIIYLKNNSTQGLHIIIDRVFFDFWTSTGGSGVDGTLKYYRNPTVTGGTAINPNNTYFDNSPDADVTASRSLTTMTGTVWWTAYITDKSSIALEEGRIVIPRGRSFGISIAAPTGNTSMIVSVNIAYYYFDAQLIA